MMDSRVVCADWRYNLWNCGPPRETRPVKQQQVVLMAPSYLPPPGAPAPGGSALFSGFNQTMCGLNRTMRIEAALAAPAPGPVVGQTPQVQTASVATAPVPSAPGSAIVQAAQLQLAATAAPVPVLLSPVGSPGHATANFGGVAAAPNPATVPGSTVVPTASELMRMAPPHSTIQDAAPMLAAAATAPAAAAPAEAKPSASGAPGFVPPTASVVLSNGAEGAKESTPKQGAQKKKAFKKKAAKKKCCFGNC